MASADAPGETRFSQPVLVVCDEGPDARLLPLGLQLDARHDPSLLFSFSVLAATWAPCLEIPPHCLSRLSRTVYGPVHRADDPPCIHLVRGELATTRNIARLRFQLDGAGRVIYPTDAILSDPPNSDAIHVITALAAASVFSVYLPNDDLPKATYNALFTAARPFFASTTRTDSATTEHQNTVSSSPPAYVLGNEGRKPRPVESDNDTVAVATPLGYDPPDDDEGQLPPYTDDEGESELLAPAPSDDARKRRVRSSSGEGAGIAGGKKRARWSPGAGLSIDTESPTPSADLDPISRLDALEARFRLLDRRSETLATENGALKNRTAALEAENRILKSRVATLETEGREWQIRNENLVRRVGNAEDQMVKIRGYIRRRDHLESRIDRLAEQHDLMEENVDHAHVRNSELEDDCGRLGTQLDTLQEELGLRVRESVQEALDEYRAELKEKILAVLDD